MEQGDACNERGKRGQGREKEQSNALCLHGIDSDSNILSQHIVTGVSCEPQNRTGLDLYHKWCRGPKKWHVRALVRRPYTCAQCNCKCEGVGTGGVWGVVRAGVFP